MRCFAVLIMLAGCQSKSEPPVARGPARIVTLSPSATEIVAALGAAGDLVGVDDYSDFPASIKALPRVGSFMVPNIETIVRLKPTLVVVDDIHAQAAGALHDAHLVTRECAMHTVPDVKTCLRTLGAALGKTAEATAAVAGIDQALDEAAAHRPAHHPRVLIVIDREAGGLGAIVAAGPGTFNDELLAVVGGDNILAGAGTKYPKIGAEEVIREKPDVILDLSYTGKDSLAVWDTLDIPAVKTKHVLSLTSQVLSHPTPRIVEALSLLATSIATN